MNTFFPEIKKNFGFGCMRFPLDGEEVDVRQVTEMVDAFLAAGFNYFDTARPYHSGKSEQILKKCLTSRYPREAYLLTDKLSGSFFETAEDVRPLFEDQLEKCGVTYFDFYLFHAMNADRHARFTQLGIYEIVKQLKAQGKIRHIGLSFHDSPAVLEQILTEHPEIEAVQLQLNYVDWVDSKVQSEKCWQICRKFGKPVLVMEPVKGGSLANLPEEAADLLTGGSPASYALRFAAGVEGVVMVLSGMSNMPQVLDNIATMADFKPLTSEEQQTLLRVRTIYQGLNKIPCTACRYCTDGCPAEIDIPAVFACLNDKHQKVEGAALRYDAQAVKADACVGCGQCEAVCPQGLHIRELLKKAAAEF